MKKILLFVFMTAAVTLLMSSCGSNNHSVPVTASNATFNTGDATNDQILKFELTISSATLTGSGGTANTPNLLTKPTEVEFVHEAGIFEPLAVLNIPPGTYSGATLSVSNPEVVVINGGAPAKVPATLSSSTITVTFNPALTISKSSSVVVNFDLNLATSVTLNGNPVTSATVAPTFNVTTSTVHGGDNEGDDQGEIDDTHGKVTAVNSPNFTIQTNQSSITFATDSNTQFKDGITSLSNLAVGAIVEVDATSETDGTKLATKVSLEEDGNNSEELEGIITAVTGSPATQITIAHQLDSEGTANAPVTVDATINSNTQFTIRPDHLQQSSLPAFDASHIGKGQRVETDTPSNTSSPVVADRIKLREQALVGTVASTPAPSATGFTLNLSTTSAFGNLTGQTSIPVLILNGTKQKVTPTAGATIRVRGLVFVNAGSYTMVAIRIDDNQ
ncbi:MAG TPA: DUF5666 domain-containing protein [Candidatus Angelobacter sp.]|nr:DUF5666 domain-containing protein [Candidatus Angelobacter sp.]